MKGINHKGTVLYYVALHNVYPGQKKGKLQVVLKHYKTRLKGNSQNLQNTLRLPCRIQCLI